jgi:hypothetical protein
MPRGWRSCQRTSSWPDESEENEHKVALKSSGHHPSLIGNQLIA